MADGFCIEGWNFALKGGMRNFDAWKNPSRSGSLRAVFVNWEGKPRACLARTHHQSKLRMGEIGETWALDLPVHLLFLLLFEP
jgi:hypothetical protein